MTDYTELESIKRAAREKAARRGASAEEIRMAGVTAAEQYVLAGLHERLKPQPARVELERVTHVDFVNKKKIE